MNRCEGTAPARRAASSPGTHERAGQRESGRIGHGNTAIRHVPCGCASAARTARSTLASKSRSLMVRESHKQAIVAVAHERLRLIDLLLSRREPCIDRGIVYAAMSARKNAPRRTRQPEVIGKWPQRAAAGHAAAAH